MRFNKSIKPIYSIFTKPSGIKLFFCVENLEINEKSFNVKSLYSYVNFYFFSILNEN